MLQWAAGRTAPDLALRLDVVGVVHTRPLGRVAAETLEKGTLVSRRESSPGPLKHQPHFLTISEMSKGWALS
jgi:hypothetical protein